MPLLSITIPTFNRAAFLAKNLQQLAIEARVHGPMLEIIVSDNASTDKTEQVVRAAISNGLPIKYIKNASNIGGDPNFSQCFNKATGKYVLILGDDDLFVDGTLSMVMKRLATADYGVVFLKPFGFEVDHRAEYPGAHKWSETVYDDVERFLVALGQHMTLISACIINKSLLPGVDTQRFCGGNLIHVHLILRAALAAKCNLYVNQYTVACQRNNSGGYDFSQVFVSNLCAVLDSCVADGLSRHAIEAIENRLMVVYYPFYLMRQRWAGAGDLMATFQRFDERFHGRVLFHYWLAPILLLPRPLAIFWGWLTTFTGRVINGDLRRGAAFAWSRLRRGVSQT